MKLFSFKSFVAIALAASSFTSFAEQNTLSFSISGTFDEIVPPCGIEGVQTFHFQFGSISPAMAIGTETEAKTANIKLRCLEKAKVSFYFDNPQSDISSSVYKTQASHIGVKVKLDNGEIRPGEKVSREALGDQNFPLQVSLYKLAHMEGKGGNFNFTLTGIIETDYL